MKPLHSLALLAAFLLLANSIVPNQAAVSWWFNDEKKDEKKVDDGPKAQPLVQKDEEGTNFDRDPLDDDDDFNDERPKFNIEDDGLHTENIQTITSLSEQQAGQNRNATDRYDTYDRRAQQSPFVDQSVPHPIVSQGPDPRFAHPQRCAEGQYTCRKESPQQAHLRCIPMDWKCNGVRDCEENDDEANCDIVPHRTPSMQCNAATQYTCYGTGVNGIPAQCVESSSVCNGVYDCQYGDDEDNDRCTQYGTRQTETVVPAQPEPRAPQPQPDRRVDAAPPVYPYPHNPQPTPTTSQIPAQQCPTQTTRSEDYVKRLEWTDRCIRSCLSNNRHK